MTAVAAGSRKLEQTYDIPTAPISTLQFLGRVKDFVKFSKAPLPFIITPHPVIGLPPEALDAYIEGNDPRTGKPVVNEIIDALTKPVGEAVLEPEADGASQPGVRQPFLAPDTEDNLQRLLYERGWTDGLPVILPTQERVQRMLAGTSHTPEEVVGEIFQFDTKKNIKCTVENVAVIAVMAGARPEHFPLILAIASTRQTAFMPSTTNFSASCLSAGQSATRSA
ncbi:MAG: hypothetical protein J2P17_05355 [Mycobacterium sp.]|nr:hypothetical protein [Mycobacterium sp.]